MVGTKPREHPGDRRRRDAESGGGQRRAGQVGDVVGRNPAHRQRHGGNQPEIVFGAAVRYVQPPLAHAAGRGATQTILAQQRLIRACGEPTQRRAAAEAPHEPLRLRAQLCIVGIQHQQAAAADHCRHRELHLGESGEVIDAVFAEMVRADIGDDRSVGARYRDSAAQNAAARGFQNGCLRAPLAHHHPRARRPGIIADRQRFIIEKHAVRAVVAGVPAVGPRARGEKPHRGGLPIGPCDDRRRNVSQLLPSDVGDIRQGGQRKIAPTRAGPQGQLRLIEDMRQPSCRGCIEQCPELRMSLHGTRGARSVRTPRIPRSPARICAAGFAPLSAACSACATSAPSRALQRSGSRSISDAHSAHSFTSVARNN